MTLPPGFARKSSSALPLYVLEAAQLPAWRDTQTAAVNGWLDAQSFTAAPGSSLLLPGRTGLSGAVIGVGDPLDPYAYGHAPFELPAGDWHLAVEPSDEARAAMQLGWGLGSYRFERYKAAPRRPARLVLDDADAHAHAETLDILAACLRVRDLVNTPTEDMGPDELEMTVRAIASSHHARVEVVQGEELLELNFPAIHAVGRASHRDPRLIAMRWGDAGNPHIVLVGKGVCFDTGGLDLKPADGMRHMKKDMGGAAHALALAGLVMARKLPVRLTLLIPAVENAIASNAYRPGEVIATRKGIHVEIDNTDAEGRVVLGDALTYASEQAPDLILDFATLTGAARVALGPDLPALFSNDDALAADWVAAAELTRDPLWRMPLWRPYLRYLDSQIADMVNAGSRMAGAVTAALYLERFVSDDCSWAHLDVYAWNDTARSGRPAGGEASGLRSAYAMLKARYPR
ncbi:MAG: leucyl aminopeptidase family protein [Xanthomonadaceae bacterium]|jgi:leucyl aminopeptidase|nr:leucyl aminopeptidase family protein [Xanthomonadaceae bacterium]